MRVSLSTFTQFVGASPSTKLTCVARHRASEGAEYDARTDYYKQLREFIPKNHRRGGSAGDLRAFASAAGARKAVNFHARAESYISWWDGRPVRWNGRGHGEWVAAGVEVAVTPEVVASFGGERCVVKLYFKKERLSVDRANVMLRLMQVAYPGDLDRDHPRFTVLDLAAGEAFENEGLGYLDAYLVGEAASFAAMNDQLV